MRDGTIWGGTPVTRPPLDHFLPLRELAQPATTTGDLLLGPGAASKLVDQFVRQSALTSSASSGRGPGGAQRQRVDWVAGGVARQDFQPR
jgi:hypothetical protein